ncbi:MAG: metalloregulator ArsR/SmtB family transcription factor, partial [Anaerovoracaceae bacterium]
AVDKVREEMLADEVYDRVTLFFKVLGDKTRLRIIWALDQHELCVCDIANVLGMTKSAISHQLRTLREANLVKCRKEGKTAFYSLADEHVKGMLASGLEHVHE